MRRHRGNATTAQCQQNAAYFFYRYRLARCWQFATTLDGGYLGELNPKKRRNRKGPGDDKTYFTGETSRTGSRSWQADLALTQDSKLLGFNDNVAPIGRMELAVEIFQVGFNGFRGDIELVRDLLVTQPFL